MDECKQLVEKNWNKINSKKQIKIAGKREKERKKQTRNCH